MCHATVMLGLSERRQGVGWTLCLSTCAQVNSFADPPTFTFPSLTYIIVGFNFLTVRSCATFQIFRFDFFVFQWWISVACFFGCLCPVRYCIALSVSVSVCLSVSLSLFLSHVLLIINLLPHICQWFSPFLSPSPPSPFKPFIPETCCAAAGEYLTCHSLRLSCYVKPRARAFRRDNVFTLSTEL